MVSPYSIPTLIGSVSALGTAILIASKDIKSKINIIFVLFCLSLFAWLFSFTIAYSIKNARIAYAWGKIGCVSVDFAGPLFYHFLAFYINIRREFKWVYLTYILAAVILILSFSTNYVFMAEPYKYYWGYYPKAGPLHILAISLHSCIMIRMLVVLYGFIKQKDTSIQPNFYNQLKYIFWGMIVLVTPGLTDYLPKYGLEIYPLGWACVILFCALIGYAMIKHQLMNINIVFRKTLVYSLLIGLITAIFVVMILFLEKFFQGFTGYRSVLASATTAFIIALIFNPAKDEIQKFVDRYFFKGTAEEIARENIKLHQELLKQDRMKAVATLAARMAHEIRNPLTVIKTFTEFLPAQHNKKKFINNFVRLVKPQIERINFTVQQLLDFSKPDMPDLKPVNICQTICEILELLSSDFLTHRIKPQIQFSDDSVLVFADLNQLKQVFLNLFLNSIDAMSQGGSLIVTSKLYDNDSVEISIQDTGDGISEVDINHIFQPFFTTKPTGTGLGLCVVYDILMQHKASIKVESKKGKGTAFIIKFPIINTKTSS